MKKLFNEDGKRLTVYLDINRIAWLEKEARRRYITVSEIVREAISKVMSEEKELSNGERAIVEVGEVISQGKIEDMFYKIREIDKETQEKIKYAEDKNRERKSSEWIISQVLRPHLLKLKVIQATEKIDLCEFIEDVKRVMVRLGYLSIEGDDKR